MTKQSLESVNDLWHTDDQPTVHLLLFFTHLCPCYEFKEKSFSPVSFFCVFFFRAFYSMICSFISSLSFLFYFFYNRMHSQTRMNFSAGIKERSTPGASLCSTLCLESEHDGVKKIHLSHTWQDTEKDPFMLPCQNNQRRLTFIRNRHYAD